jgi:hypothetical protein
VISPTPELPRSSAVAGSGMPATASAAVLVALAVPVDGVPVAPAQAEHLSPRRAARSARRPLKRLCAA